MRRFGWFMVLSIGVGLGAGLMIAATPPPSPLPTLPVADRRYQIQPETLRTMPIEALRGPIVIAVQTGHYQVAELPDELKRLRGNTGAEYGAVKEVDINRQVALSLIPLLRRRGYQVVDLPATIQTTVRADAFVAIHADWAGDAQKAGWKLSPPWRSSQRSRELAAAMSAALAQATELPKDPAAPSNGMRGYYGFNYLRYAHAISPFTPAVLIEMGFLTNAQDRARLLSKPGYYATAIDRGVAQFIAAADRAKTEAYRPMVLTWQMAGAKGADVYFAPNDKDTPLRALTAGTVVMPVDKLPGWYEVFVRSVRQTGWVRETDLEPTDDPWWPLPGELDSR